MSDDLKAAVATLEHFIQWKPEQRSGQDVIIAVRRVLDALREAQVVNKRLHKNIDINLELLEKTEAKLTAEESAHEATRRAGLQTVATLEAQLAELQRENERLHKNIDINLELLEKAEAALAAERERVEKLRSLLEANIPPRTYGSLQEEVDFLRRDVASLQANKHNLITRLAAERERSERLKPESVHRRKP